MIQGKFGEKGQLFFEIELITYNRLNLPVDTMLDTGFTGFMAINKQDLESLDWEYEINVYVGNEITEVLLGSEWLKILPLVANYQVGILTLG
ncbi:MAG: aspartyl protease [Nostoc sp.]|uniref:aspartyl protease n=1 Tax=Nostoc sp. TaxID=1180 RepID=UPI002FFB27BD